MKNLISQNDKLLEIVRTISASPLELSAETILKKILMDSYQPDFLEIFEINPKAKAQELHLEEKTEIVEETRFEINRLVERITASGKPEISTLKSSNTKLLIGIPVNWSPIKYIVVAMIANDNNTFSRVQQDEFINFLRFLEYLLRQKTEANQLLRQNRQLTEVAEQRHRELEQVKNELKSNLEKLDHDRLTALKKYEQIFDKSLNAFALHEIIVDETLSPSTTVSWMSTVHLNF